MKRALRRARVLLAIGAFRLWPASAPRGASSSFSSAERRGWRMLSA